MKRLPHPLAALGLVWVGMLACGGPPRLDTDAISFNLKSDIIANIGETLLERGYVHGVNWLLWNDYVKQHRTALDAAATYGDFGSSLNAALQEFDVSHLWVWTPHEFRMRKEGRQAGLGLKTVRVDDGRLVTRVTPESPASLAGMARGDVVVRVGGQPVFERGFSSGVAGDTVTVEWLRGDEQLSAKMTFGRFSRAPQAELRWPRSDVAWLTIPTFSYGIYNEDTVDMLIGDVGDAPALILDLRSNGGGWSDHVEHLAALLLPPGSRIAGEVFREKYDEFLTRIRRVPETLAEVVNTTGQWVHTPVDVGGPHYDGTLIVLVDGRSASGGECFPATIQDHGRGTLIGTTTAGHVLAGDEHVLTGGYFLFYPQGEIIRPDGHRLESVGVQPDIPLSARQTVDDEFILTVALWCIDAPSEPSPDAQIGLIIQ